MGGALIPAGESGEPAFAYTVGLFEKFRHPELIVIGLPHEVMHSVLNLCGERVRGGEWLTAGADVPDILEGYGVRPREVRERASFAAHVGYAGWYYEGWDFPLLQILWPDKSGRFPGDGAFDAGLARVQPILP